MALDLQPDDELDLQLDIQPDDEESDGFLKKALGAGEAVLGTASSLVSAIPHGFRALGELAATGDLSTALERAESSGDFLTYEPRTQTGKALTKGVMDTLSDYQQEVGRKFSGDTGYLAGKKPTKANLAAENTERFVGELIGGVFVPGIGSAPRRAKKAPKADTTLDGIKAKQAEIDAREAKAAGEVDVNLPELHDEALTRRLQKIDAGINEGRIKPYDKDVAAAEKQAVADSMARMTDDAIMEQLKHIDSELAKNQAARDIQGLREYTQALVDERSRRERERSAQAVLEKRQAELERGVREKTSVPLLHQEMVETAPDRFTLDPQARDARGLLPDQLARDRMTQEQAPVPGVEGVINRVNQEVAADPRTQAAEARVSGVEERAVDSGAYGEAHTKFMEESLRVAEQNAENLKAELGSEKRANPLNLPPTSRLSRVRRGQRGAVGNLNPGERSRTIIDDLKDRFGGRKKKEKDGETDLSFVPNDPDPQQTLKESRGQRDSNQWNMTESGGVLAAMKRGSALIRDGVRFVQNAGKRADLHIRRNVFPVEKALRSLKKEEITSLAGIMKAEMLQGKRFSPEALSSQLNTSQLAAYAHMRHLFDDTLRIQNMKRAEKGQPPITEMEAYLSSRWDGDFRRPVYQAVLDKNGNPKFNEKGELERKLVWYLASNTKRGLEKQWKALHKEHPDLMFEESMDHVVKYYKRETDLQSVYSTILDILGRNDPHVEEMGAAIKKIQDALKDQTVNEAATFLGQEKHFKEKTGVRGFVGDRPGKQGTFEEALAMFQQQIQYAKNAYKWSEMQTAGKGLKELFSDPDLAKAQPNNIKYLKEYFKNNIGYGEHHAISRLEDSIRGLGVSPTMLNDAVGSAKSFFILQKLALNAGYSLAGLIQSANVAPYITHLWGQKILGNPITALPVGVAGGMALATGHYANFFSKGKLSHGVNDNSAFYKKAFRYAEDNGVTARSLMDESPIESSFSAVGRTANAAGKTMVPPEVAGRSMAFMFFTEFLRSSGKFKGRDLELFQKAEELVNASMVDYRAGERPMLFSKLGAFGNFLNTLQTYPVNWYNQWNFFAREAMKGNPGPAMTAFATQYAIAGAMGIPGFSDMDKLYQYVKDNMKSVVSNKTYAKMREHPFWNDPKVWMMQNFGNDSVYGWLSDATGIGMTSRVAAPSAGDMLQSPAGPITDIAKQIGNLGSAILDPTNTDKWAQSAMSSVPPGLQGALEQAPFMEGTTFEKRPNGDIVPQRPGDIQDHKGVTVRTPAEQKLRNFGLRSQREVVDRELGYRFEKDKRTGQQRAVSMVDEIYAAAKRGDKEEVRDLYSAYVKLTGNRISKEAWKAQVEENYFSTMERSGRKAKQLPITDLKALARIQSILEEVDNEHERRGVNQTN